MPELLALHARSALSRHVCAFCRRQARVLSYSSAERQSCAESHSFQELTPSAPDVITGQSHELQATSIADDARRLDDGPHTWTSDSQRNLPIAPGHLTAQDVLQQLRNEPAMRRRSGRYSRPTAAPGERASQLRPSVQVTSQPASAPRNADKSAKANAKVPQARTTFAASQRKRTYSPPSRSTAATGSRTVTRPILKPLSGKFAIGEASQVLLPTAHEGGSTTHTTGLARPQPKTDLSEAPNNPPALTRPHRAAAPPRRAIPFEVQADKIQSRADKAVVRTDVVYADDLLQQLRKLEVEHETKVPLETYAELQRMFLKLRLPHQAFRVLYLLQKAGYDMTANMWTTMFRHSNSEHTDQMWKIMQSQDVKPTVGTWNARIYALVHNHQPDAAMMAVEDSSRDLADTYKAAGGVLDIATAALAAFASMEGYTIYISSLIKWMQTQNLQRDVTTYNVLLNVALRSGLHNTVESLLEQMRGDGVTPDGNTATTLMVSLFEADLLKGKTEAEIPGFLMQMLDHIEDQQVGATMSAKGYNRAMHEVSIRGNVVASRALLRRMRIRGVHRTKHTYTTLTDLYLAQNPPDYKAFQSLLKDAFGKMNELGAQLDVTFNNRALERLADAHTTIGLDKTQKMLQHMIHHSIRPTWPAIQCVARAYIESQSRDLLVELVRDIASNEGIAAHGFDHEFGRRYFWEMIKKAGVPQNVRAIAEAKSVHAQGPVVDALTCLEAGVDH